MIILLKKVKNRILNEFGTIRQLKQGQLSPFVRQGNYKSNHFEFVTFRKQVNSFLDSLNVNGKAGLYKYSHSCTIPNIYASSFVCIAKSLLRSLNNTNEIEEWKEYLCSFQRSSDGLYEDPAIKNKIFETSDWWGARHLAVIVNNALICLNAKSKHDFYFLEAYYQKNKLIEWLESVEWEQQDHSNDIDNKIMNIGALLQYSRDYHNNKHSEIALKNLITWLNTKRNQDNGLWGPSNFKDIDELSRAVQFSYHLLPLYFYDNLMIPQGQALTDLVLETQNSLGGYGVKLNSSACEDIDSIDILIRVSKVINHYKSSEIKTSLQKAFAWIFANQNADGGFVFRRNEPFEYGHPEMFSTANESSAFATWFRLLSIAYLCKELQVKNDFNLVRTPGYQF